MAHQPRAKVNPELTRQLDEADGPVGAAVTLRPTDPSHLAVPANAVEDLAREVLARVSRLTGQSPNDVHVLPNLGQFLVSAPGSFLQTLLDQPEVAEATASHRTESLMIRPVKTRPA